MAWAILIDIFSNSGMTTLKRLNYPTLNMWVQTGDNASIEQAMTGEEYELSRSTYELTQNALYASNSGKEEIFISLVQGYFDMQKNMLNREEIYTLNEPFFNQVFAYATQHGQLSAMKKFYSLQSRYGMTIDLQKTWITTNSSGIKTPDICKKNYDLFSVAIHNNQVGAARLLTELGQVDMYYTKGALLAYASANDSEEALDYLIFECNFQMNTKIRNYLEEIFNQPPFLNGQGEVRLSKIEKKLATRTLFQQIDLALPEKKEARKQVKI